MVLRTLEELLLGSPDYQPSEQILEGMSDETIEAIKQNSQGISDSAKRYAVALRDRGPVLYSWGDDISLSRMTGVHYSWSRNYNDVHELAEFGIAKTYSRLKLRNLSIGTGTYIRLKTDQEVEGSPTPLEYVAFWEKELSEKIH